MAASNGPSTGCCPREVPAFEVRLQRSLPEQSHVGVTSASGSVGELRRKGAVELKGRSVAVMLTRMA